MDAATRVATGPANTGNYSLSIGDILFGRRRPRAGYLLRADYAVSEVWKTLMLLALVSAAKELGGMSHSPQTLSLFD
jgi:hypothetical protein